jgi:hypothetical protein
MKTCCATIVALILTFSVFGQKADCSRFKTGLFYYPTLQFKESLREDSTQMNYSKGKLEAVWSVQWVSNCEYTMTCQKVLVSSNDVKVGDKIEATIIKTDGDCCTVSLIVYNASNPKGFRAPNVQMCIKKAD